MSKIAFKFDKTKATEAILYLAQRISEHDIYGICKLLYLADKTSLEKYGRFIFGETYYAMVNGATPSNAYDLIKNVAIEPIDDFKLEGNDVIPQRDPDLNYLSKSDIECLDLIIKIYGQMPYWMRRKAAHDEAWQSAWDKKGNKDSKQMPVETIAALLDDSDNLIDYLRNPDRE